jgi:integrase
VLLGSPRLHGELVEQLDAIGVQVESHLRPVRSSHAANMSADISYVKCGRSKAAKLPHSRVHALRHSFASALITDNQNPKLVQTLLGHHSAAFTMDVYSGLWPTALEGIGERIAATLFSGDGSKLVAATPSEGLKGCRPSRKSLI